MRRTLTQTLTITLATLVTMVASQSAYADFRNYEARLDYSKWILDASPIQCSLTHDIPKYGIATFTSAAGRRANLNFNLSLRRYNPVKISQAVLTSEPPLWRHDRSKRDMGKVLLIPGDTPVHNKNSNAWSLLAQLEQGMFPTFSYDSWLDKQDQISVALSAVNFQPVYDGFLDCVASLLPYNFEDIEETFVYFEFDRSDFTSETRASLARIGDWLAVDKTMELVLVVGHTDSKGKLHYNMKLGKRRADAVKKFFIKAGIPTKQIKTQSFADLQPLSSNATPEGRAKNRRVMIKMIK
ncbi:MAG: OmpA family protein [Gammaproteobacteria bacterium]|nr:OmpA family protein [Gammaproteobacteria bacterium]